MAHGQRSEPGIHKNVEHGGEFSAPSCPNLAQLQSREVVLRPGETLVYIFSQTCRNTEIVYGVTEEEMFEGLTPLCNMRHDRCV
jgi:hypothetical protein